MTEDKYITKQELLDMLNDKTGYLSSEKVNKVQKAKEYNAKAKDNSRDNSNTV